MATSDVTMTLSADLPKARLTQIARDMERDLCRNGVNARPIEAPAVPGARGEPVTLGVLVLALITSGAVAKLLECYKAHLSREPRLTITIKRPDGTLVEVNARNIDSPALREALAASASASLA